MIAPTGAIIPLFLVAFVLLAFQYFRLNPDRRLLNLHFTLMAGGLVLAFIYILAPDIHTPLVSMVFLALGLFWLVITLLLFRTLPPPKH